MYQVFNFAGNLVALFAPGSELLGQTQHDDGCGPSAGHDHRLFAEFPNDFGRKAFAHAWGEFGESVRESPLAGRGELGRWTISLPATCRCRI